MTVCAFGAVLFTYGRYAGWWLAREAAEVPAGKPSVAQTELPPRTVAVLPFENLSADAGDEFVAFGVAESVLHRLASIQDLTLIARTSSFAFRDKAADARDIGRRLNARYLVEGSVHRAGDRLRVTAQLIEAATGGHVWSLGFDRTVDDIFAVEDEISQSVARALEVEPERGRTSLRPIRDRGIPGVPARAALMGNSQASRRGACHRAILPRTLSSRRSAGRRDAALAEAHIFLFRI